jgi:mannitol/fructose-specific phosphotransferase system IIA component (Ntr-type)
MVSERCVVLDLQASMTLPEFLDLAIERLAPVTDIPPGRLVAAFHSREAESSTVVKAGIAIPHIIVNGLSRASMLLARCRGGVIFPGENEPVHAILMLVEGLDHRFFHLQALAALSRSAHDPHFMEKWLSAGSVEELRDQLLETHRSRCTLHRSACV